MEAYDEFAPFYDPSDFDRRPEVAFYASIAPPRCRSILELGCGTGKIVGELADELDIREHPGWRAAGLEISRPMLGVARSRYPDLEWIEGDMRSPQVNGTFDMIICPFNALQQLESEADVTATLRSAGHLLNAGGTIAFDVYNASHAPLARGFTAPEPDRLVRTFRDERARVFEVREDVHQDSADTYAIIDWRIVDPADKRVAGTLRLKYRHYHASDIDRIVDQAGLSVRAKYGNVRKEPFSVSGSKKQVVVCERPA